MQKPATPDYARGAIYGLAAVVIWAGFIVVSRLGVRTSLTPWDVTAIRFAVAGTLLLPYLMRKGLALGWSGLTAIVMGLFAPAAHGGALFPGVMPLMVAILAAAILKEAFTSQSAPSGSRPI
jgi:drug/metabolite transporter (DMT)-like permease